MGSQIFCPPSVELDAGFLKYAKLRSGSGFHGGVTGAGILGGVAAGGVGAGGIQAGGILKGWNGFPVSVAGGIQEEGIPKGVKGFPVSDSVAISLPH